MTRVADQMTQNGLLERCEDSNDKRRVRVRLTNSGRKIAMDLVGQAQIHEKKLLSTLKDTDASHIKHALQALLQALDENTNELPPVLKRPVWLQLSLQMHWPQSARQAQTEYPVRLPVRPSDG